LDSSQFKQTLHIVHAINHFDALVVNNPLLNLQYTQQLAQCTLSGNHTLPIHMNSDFDMRMTEIVEPACHQKQPQEHSSQAIDKRKLPSFIVLNTTAAIAKPTQGQDSACNGLLYHLYAQGNSSLGITGIWSPDAV
jgi:hypothetical protein